jgi:hypothetical protein
MLLQLDTFRFVRLFVFQPSVLVFFALVIYRSVRVKRGSAINNFIICYSLVSLGLLLNTIYGMLRVEPAVVFLNFLTNFCISLSPAFLVLMNRSILAGEDSPPRLLELAGLGAYALLLLLAAVFYPFGAGVVISEGTGWSPVWRLPIYVYVTAVLSAGGAAPLVLTAAKVYLSLEAPRLRKKWLLLFIGIAGQVLYIYLVFLYNFSRIGVINLLSVLDGALLPLWVYLIYRVLTRRQ